jgi:hypothetical protein
LDALTSEDVLKYRQQLEAGGRAPLTINLTIKRVLRRAFKIAMDEGLIARNPCATVRSIRDIGKVEKGTFTPEPRIANEAYRTFERSHHELQTIRTAVQTLPRLPKV